MVVRDPRVSNWRRSSACDESGCVEVAIASTEVLVRDSRDTSGKVLTVSFREWEAFILALRDDLGAALSVQLRGVTIPSVR